MAVSLHGLRWKIAAAAVFTRTARRVGRAPIAARLISATANRLEPADQEVTGSYRGIAAGLLRRTLPAEETEEGIVYDSVAGLVRGTPEPPSDAAELSARAERSPSAGNLLAAASAHRRPYVSDLAAAAEYYERAVRANPKDLRAVEGVLTIGSRTHFDWPRIWNVVQLLIPRRGRLRRGTELWQAIGGIFEQTPRDDAVDRALSQLQEHQHRLPLLHQLLLEAIAARLHFLGQFSAGTRLREAMAHNRVRELVGIPLESGIWLKHLLGAYAYLEEDHRLEATALEPPVDLTDARTRIQAEKLAADAALMAGDAEPLRTHAIERRAQVQLPGDDLMSGLVTGRRVAVVGPAGGDGLGELIESYDVVVRTRHTPAGEKEHAGSRTDIAYYAGRDLLRDYQEVSETAESGTIQLAVTRPFFVEAPLLEQWPEWLRAARFEHGLYFRGAAQGVQRIIYDLLQFHPAEIAVFNADFYAGQSLAAEGYRASYSAFGPNNQTNDVVAMHDVAYEFRWTRQLSRSGLITAHGTAAEVLGLSVEQYLRRLEAGPLGQGAVQR